MFGLVLERTSAASLPQQLTRQIRERILEGRLAPREALPPSRLLAKELGVARNVIVQAYDQLLAEGYLTSRVGAGTFVTELAVLPAPARPFTGPLSPQPKAVPRTTGVISFNPGLPDLTRFPRQSWARALKEACAGARPGTFSYGRAEGERALREALVGYLWRSKGIECRPEQLLIVSGAAQGADLLAHLWRNTGTALFEDPGYGHVRRIFEHNGLRIVPVPVDGCGMRTEALPARGPCTCIYVVPSHHFPLGGVLPIQRRLELLAYARERGALVIEDDYDSEFRYRGGPIQSLRHLASESVVFLGTFSKILAPALRLGFMIVPDHLRERLRYLKEELNMRTPALEQLALASLLEDRSLDRHVFRMKKLYQNKRRCLIEALGRAFGDRVRVAGEDAGLHLLVELTGRSLRQSDLTRLAERGVTVEWVEDYACRKGLHNNQLVLGYGALEPDRIRVGVQRLKAALDEMPPVVDAR